MRVRSIAAAHKHNKNNNNNQCHHNHRSHHRHISAHNVQRRSFSSPSANPVTALASTAARVPSPFNRGTKLIATLGPSSSSIPQLRKLFQAGADIFRLNFSHGDHAQQLDRINNIHTVAAEFPHKSVGILQDLCGPKIRTSPLEDGIEALKLEAGMTLVIKDDPNFKGKYKDSKEVVVGCSYPSLHKEISPKHKILLSDGLISLICKDVRKNEIICEVATPGNLKGKQGINLPGSSMTGVPSITEKDLLDLEFGLRHGVDFVALSFVRSANDIQELRDKTAKIISEKFASRSAPLPWIIAKIEKPAAVDDIENIAAAADGIMVARGDLGVELPLEEVPIQQKRIIRAANRHGVPVIVATQMMESMISSPRPTRAEVSDVSNAIFDGADACMLSAETATGAFPDVAVRVMADVAKTTEQEQFINFNPNTQMQFPQLKDTETVYMAIAHAAAAIASSQKISAIVAETNSGRTPTLISRERPTIPIVALTPNRHVCRRLQLIRNVFPFQVPMVKSIIDLSKMACKITMDQNIAKSGDYILLCGSHPLSPDPKLSIPTNFLKILKLGEPLPEVGLLAE